MKTSKRPRRQWSPEEKSQIVREFQESGRSAHDFCKRQGLAASSLNRWIDHFDAGESGSAAFVELTGLLPQTQAEGDEYHYELTLVSGHRLRLRRGFDSGEVQALAAALVSNA
jgi:transposase-like protein